MTKQKNSPQKTEQEAVPTAGDLVSTDISRMSELEIRMMTIKMLAGLEESTEDTRDSLFEEIKSLSGEIKELKSNQR